MLPLIVPAVPVFTATVMPLALVEPAVRPVIWPVPRICEAPVPEDVPKRTFRSSTKPAAPVAELVMLSTCETDCPTCTVPKFSVVGAFSVPVAAT